MTREWEDNLGSPTMLLESDSHVVFFFLLLMIVRFPFNPSGRSWFRAVAKIIRRSQAKFQGKNLICSFDNWSAE